MRRELLTIREAAEALHVHRSTVYRLSWRGKLPILKIAPGISRIRQADLDSILEQARLLHTSGGQEDGAR